MSDNDPQGQESSYGLLMPFVTVQSKGGPHEDAAYVAGYEMGLLDARLSVLDSYVTAAEFQIHSESAQQADLIAMRYGFKTVITVYDDCPEWSHMVVTRSQAVSDDH